MSHNLPGSEPADWAVRVVSTGARASRAHARNHTIELGEQASLKPSDPAPSAVEYLLAALGGDLAAGFRREAARRRVEIDALELSLRGRLDNVLVHLGVIGEEGHAGFAAIEGSLYVSTGADEQLIAEVWENTRLRSPVYQTLSRATRVEIRLQITA